MANAAMTANGFCCLAGVSGLHLHRRLASKQPHAAPLTVSAVPTSLIRNTSIQKRVKSGTRLYSMAALPMFSLAAVEIITETNDWTLDEPTLKTIYLVFSVIFCWGCCVSASMNDPFYESDIYRKAGGDGTQHWMYLREEEEEVNAREELWREELVQEIEEKVGELRELEDADKEKEKELV